MAQDYSQQFSMFAGDPYGAAMNQMNNASSYGYGPTGLNLNDFTGIMLSNAMQPTLQPQEIIGGEQDEGYDFTMPEEEERGIFDILRSFALDDQYRNPRTFLSTLALGPLAGLTSYFSGGIMDAIKGFNDRRRGRLNVTADAGFGNVDSGGFRSESQQDFSSSQSYGGGGTMDDLGADTF